MKIVTLKMPEPLVLLIDSLSRKLGYSSRSEFIREAVRYYVEHLIRQGMVRPEDIPAVMRAERSNMKIVKVVEVEE